MQPPPPHLCRRIPRSVDTVARGRRARNPHLFPRVRCVPVRCDAVCPVESRALIMHDQSVFAQSMSSHRCQGVHRIAVVSGGLFGLALRGGRAVYVTRHLSCPRMLTRTTFSGYRLPRVVSAEDLVRQCLYPQPGFEQERPLPAMHHQVRVGYSSRGMFGLRPRSSSPPPGSHKCSSFSHTRDVVYMTQAHRTACLRGRYAFFYLGPHAVFRLRLRRILCFMTGRVFGLYAEKPLTPRLTSGRLCT